MTKNIQVLALLLIVLVGCNNTSIVEEEVIDLPVPEHGYILFNTGVDSRGKLIEESLTDDFKVHGYCYTNTWDAAKVLATPNVFCGKLIRYEENVHSYDPMEPWIGTQKYSFFAYYPTDVSTISDTYEGNPYIEYTLASRIDPTLLKDVMTAHVIDTDASARTVDFTMKHRLAAIDVVARNFDDDNNVEVKNLTIHFDNLLYDKVTLPLNTGDDPELKDTIKADNIQASYPIVGDTPIVIPPGGDETVLSTDKNKKVYKSMIVIPQKDYLTGYIKLDFKNETGTWITKDNPDTKFSTNCEILPGRRYYVQLTLTQEDVTIAILKSEEWEDKDKIYHEFE